MQSSKLIAILRSLNKHEMRKFGEMVRSPYFHIKKEALALFEFLEKKHPRFQDVDKSSYSRALPRGSARNDKSLRYAMSELSKAAEQFLILKEFESGEEEKNHLLLKAYLKKNLLKYAPALIERNRHLLERSPLRDDKHFFLSFLTEKDYYEYVASRRNVAVHKNLNRIIFDLDTFYMINKLKLSAEMINLSEAWAVNYDPVMLNEILQHLKNSKNIDTPAVRIYYEIVKMLTATPSEPHYFRLKELLKTHGGLFPREELNDMYIFARNYCAQKINSGDTGYLSEVFDLYRMLLKDEVLIVNGFLSQWDYKNITAVALRVEAFDWAYDFIMNFKEKIRAEDRENAYSFNLANYYYHKKEYEKTMSLVQHVVFTDTYYNLDCKVLLMKSYFELEEIQALQSLIDSFYMYLKRNKAISEFQRSSYLNFLRIVRKLLRLKPGDEKKRAAILLELDRSHPIANVSWLKKKLNPA